ncbi:MAG: hypothetical protein ACM3VT_06535 [Solirubrobacterales bacterium]
MTTLKPENITLGMLRLVPGHLSLARQACANHGASLRDASLSEKASDGKLRYPAPRRVEFYRFLIGVIRSFEAHPSISLCRETPDVWNELNHLCDPGRCNCLAW